MAGLGGHGHTIQTAVEQADGFEVAVVVDPADAEAEDAARRFGCARAASLDEALARDDLDALVLVTPNHLHRAQVEAALDAGLDVFVEKPIANTVADGRAMAEAADAAGRIMMVGHNMRFSRSAVKARETITGGRLGDVVSFEVHFSAANTRFLAADAWRLHPDRCPLMPVMQLGIHGLDLIHFLLAPIDEVHAYARSVTTRPEVTDSVAAVLQIEGGPIGTLVSNYCTQVLFEIRIAGTDGLLRMTPHDLWFRTTEGTDPSGDGPAEVDDFRAFAIESYVRQMDAFGDALRRRVAPASDGWSGLQALAVVEALQRSIAADAPQQVPMFRQAPVTD
jgi:predicted dehydrogenase